MAAVAVSLLAPPSISFTSRVTASQSISRIRVTRKRCVEASWWRGNGSWEGPGDGGMTPGLQVTSVVWREGGGQRQVVSADDGAELHVWQPVAK